MNATGAWERGSLTRSSADSRGSASSGLVIGVDAVNGDALRFYERRGFRVGYHLLYGRLGAPGAGVGPADDEGPETASHGEA